MQDQAFQLRRLMMDEQASRTPDLPPKFITVTGGSGQVGNSTLAVAIAARMARSGERILLIDGDLSRGSIARLTGIQDRECCLQDVLDGNTRLCNAFQPGPHGLLVLPSQRASLATPQYSEESLGRLFKDTVKLSPMCDLIILDCGHGEQRLLSASLETTDKLIVTTTTDPQVVTQTYQRLKTLVLNNPKYCDDQVRFALMVNGAENEQEAADVAKRLNDTTLRFLGLPVEFHGWTPKDDRLLEFRKDSLTNGLLDAIAARTIDTPKVGGQNE